MKYILFIAVFFSGMANSSELMVGDDVTKNFMTCGESKEMRKIVNDLLKSNKPTVKTDSYFEFSLKGNVLGVPFKSVWVGVCNKNGERSCGESSFRAYVLDMPHKEIQMQLKTKYKIDFTVEQRNNAADATDRPVLSYIKNKKISTLFCDAGSL